MKKMLLVLVALLIATPAMATVTLTKTIDNANKKVTIGYTDDGVKGTTKARAFALKISADVASGAVITNVAKDAAHNLGKGYGIFPGTIAINETTGQVTEYNEPLERDNYPVGIGGQSAKNTRQVIIAMGSLYKGDANAPASSGNLVTVTVDKACTLTIEEEESVRGGVIAEDATALTVAPITAQITADVECMKSTAPEYAAWVSFGKPNCWCFQRQCKGDVDGIKVGPYWVQANDLTAFRLAFNKADTALPVGGICSDLDHAKVGPYRVQANDLTIFRLYFNKGETIVTPCPMTNLNSYKN